MVTRDENKVEHLEEIQSKIHTIRGVQVMLDRDLAEIYGVKTKRLNEQVKRNIDRFPEQFRFQLTTVEANLLGSQFATLEVDKIEYEVGTGSTNGRGKHRKYLPYAFTEQGVAMLSAVLRSETAVKVSIQIMQTFVEMRHFRLENSELFNRIERVEQKQITTDNKIDKIFKALDNSKVSPKQGIFFDGQIFDAYKLLSEILAKAEHSIFIVDNYIDVSILSLFSSLNPQIRVKLFTRNIDRKMELDVKKFNLQYQRIELIKLTKSHDRFIIIDEKDAYHLGASLKDLGKKWFAFSKLEYDTSELIYQLKKY